MPTAERIGDEAPPWENRIVGSGVELVSELVSNPRRSVRTTW
jgi:hypothetical protein